MSRNEVLATLRTHAGELRKLGVRDLALFGSTARDECGPASDLDFLVRLDRKTFDSYMDVKFFLEDLFGRKVDLVLEDGLKPRIRESIAKDLVHAVGL
jgi:uncharacterized protein